EGLGESSPNLTAENCEKKSCKEGSGKLEMEICHPLECKAGWSGGGKPT
ncbi:hypothetical protein Tco_1223139, partial [Tanacetum coccineum]